VVAFDEEAGISIGVWATATPEATPSKNPKLIRFPKIVFLLNIGYTPETVLGLKFRKRKALATTDTELNAIAPPAIIGLSNQPKMGNKIPAAMGIPATL
jgi:hypothetical protein